MKRLSVIFIMLMIASWSWVLAQTPIITDVQASSFVAGQKASVEVSLEANDATQPIQLIAWLNCTGSFDIRNKPVKLFTYISPQLSIPADGQIELLTNNILPDVPQQCVWQVRVVQGYDESMSYWGTIFDIRSKQWN